MRTQWARQIKNTLHGQPDRRNWKRKSETGEPEGEREEMEWWRGRGGRENPLRGYVTWLLKDEIDDQRKYWKYRKNA